MRAAVFALLVAAFYATAPGTDPKPAGCSAQCDKAAADCADACEAKFPTDPSPRISCKLECGKQREACESACGSH